VPPCQLVHVKWLQPFQLLHTSPHLSAGLLKLVISDPDSLLRGPTACQSQFNFQYTSPLPFVQPSLSGLLLTMAMFCHAKNTTRPTKKTVALGMSSCASTWVKIWKAGTPVVHAVKGDARSNLQTSNEEQSRLEGN
jgi:hypothetical protein